MIRSFPLAALLLAESAAAQTAPPPSVAPANTPAAPAHVAVGPADPPARLPAAARARLRIVATANRTATRGPVAHAFLNAAMVYPWSEGAVYRLYAAPERVSDIALQPGERLVSIAAGDTARWTMGDTTSGAGESKRTHILLKPFSAGLKTNLMIATDRRTYHVELESSRSTAMLAISWSYPADQLIALRRDAEPPDAAAPSGTGVPLERLRFGYSITGDRPAWRPLRAFDDGRQTYIEFPATLGQSEAPPLFVLGDEGDAQLVNYRQRGRYYVVDRLFAAAELRLGSKRQKVVRIQRTDATAHHRRIR